MYIFYSPLYDDCTLIITRGRSAPIHNSYSTRQQFITSLHNMVISVLIFFANLIASENDNVQCVGKLLQMKLSSNIKKVKTIV